MNRRRFTALLGVAGFGTLAGCVGDGGSDENGSAGPSGDGANATETPTRTETATETPTETDSNEAGRDDETVEATPDDPVAAAEAFLDALDSKQRDRINTLIAPDGPFRELDPDDVDAFTDKSIETESVDIIEETDEEVVLEITVRIGGERAPPTRLALRRNNGWKVWRFDVAPGEPVPTVDFDVDHTGEAITITHESGDRVAAGELHVRGEGLSETGSWAALGGATTEDDGRAVVRAGHDVTVPAEESAAVRIVWESSDGDRSETLQTVDIASEREVASEPAPEDVREYLDDARNFHGLVADYTGEDDVVVEAGDPPGVEEPMAFDPAAIRIDPGTTVTWEHAEGGMHIVATETGLFEDATLDAEDERWSYTFEEERTVLYYCVPHRALGAKGAIIVG